jgi:hypothetical protein
MSYKLNTETFVTPTVLDVAVASQTPTVTAGAYATGEVVGSKLTFADATLSGKTILQAVGINCKSAQTAAFDLILFNDDPSASTFTDNEVIAVHASDQSKVCGVVHITDWTNLGTPSYAQAKNEAYPISLTGTALYGVLVTRGTPTLASTSDITVTVRLLRN